MAMKLETRWVEWWDIQWEPCLGTHLVDYLVVEMDMRWAVLTDEWSVDS